MPFFFFGIRSSGSLDSTSLSSYPDLSLLDLFTLIMRRSLRIDQKQIPPHRGAEPQASYPWTTLVW